MPSKIDVIQLRKLMKDLDRAAKVRHEAGEKLYSQSHGVLGLDNIRLADRLNSEARGIAFAREALAKVVDPPRRTLQDMAPSLLTKPTEAASAGIDGG